MPTKGLERSVRPGIHPQLDISDGGPSEQKIIRRFAKVFNISFFRTSIFKEVNYTFAFGKPTEEFTLKFNLSSEILILFNYLDNFENRTFDYVDKLTQDFQNRLEKYCIILVSRDNSVCLKIEALNAMDNMARVVVPFTYDELLSDNQDRYLIENRFKKFFYSRDLFDFGSPITSESFFFGRSRIVQHFIDKYTNSENAALFGLRKIGKTSVLYAVKRLSEMKHIPVIYIDCQSPDFHMKRWHEALRFIIQLGLAQNGLSGRGKFSTEPYPEKEATVFFEKELREIQRVTSRQNILLIFDEIENITFEISPTKHWAHDTDFLLFWQAIRSIFQSSRNVFSFIIAGVNPKILETTSIDTHDNPVYKIASPMYLELFSLETVQEMVTKIGRYMGISFDEEVFFHLFEDFGGHPFLTRIACSNMNKRLKEVARPHRISKYWYKENRQLFSKDAMNYVEQLLSVLKNFYKEEYEMIKVLASGDVREFSEFVNLSPTYSEHLAGYGLVNVENNEYYFKLRIVEDYLQSESNLKKFFNTNEEKWAEISKRRNSIESRLRNLANVLLTATYGAEKARIRILEVIPKERRHKFENKTLSEIYVNNFFFLDLAQLYIKEFKLFENIFEKKSDRFYATMQHINQYRVDAHAKEIDDYDFQLLLHEFQWIEECLKQVKI